MNKESKEQAKQRTQLLVQLRKQHGEGVKRAQELLKQQQAIRKTLLKAMQDEPRSVPQLAEATGLAAHQVLWHVAALKKYGVVEEAGLDEAEDYYLYRLSKEAAA